MTPKKLTHTSRDGRARMVDVSAKAVTERFARAAGCIRMNAEAYSAIERNSLAKGDVIAVASLAGVMAAKRTSELVPLSHTLELSDIKVDLMLDRALPGLRCESVVRTTAKTGVEMEAITAVSVALITVYDMAKSIDKSMQINEIELLEKAGGKSGHWRRESRKT